MIVGLGLDLAEITRFNFSEQKRRWFERRIFGDCETLHARRGKRSEQHLAGFFAAKEAFRKACGRAFAWRDVVVTHLPSGAPTLLLSGKARQFLDEHAVTKVHVTITHTGQTAAAVVVLERQAEPTVKG